MKNKLETIIENLEKGETLTIGDQTLLNEFVLDQSVQCSLLGKITFFEVDFKRIDFTESTFMNCEFKNCRFKDVTIRNCNFLNVYLSASDFSDFEFIKTKFNNSNLDLIGARFIKVWKSDQCTEIAESSNFGNFLEDMSCDG